MDTPKDSGEDWEFCSAATAAGAISAADVATTSNSLLLQELRGAGLEFE
jgi:hypothetical protein